MLMSSDFPEECNPIDCGHYKALLLSSETVGTTSIMGGIFTINIWEESIVSLPILLCLVWFREQRGSLVLFGFSLYMLTY